MDSSIKKLVEGLYTTNEYGYKYQDPDAVPDPKIVEHFEKEYGIRTDVHRTCVNCQIRQIAKYEPAHRKSEGFEVKCNFIPRGLPRGSAKKVKEISASSDISYDRAKKLLLSTIDPVAWAELMFGFDDSDDLWHIRSYQKEQIRCTGLRIACREGRRSGKTFAMALKLTYYAYNLKVKRGRDAEGNQVTHGPEIMIVTPYQSQLTNIFNEIESLIKRNIELRKEVTSGTTDSLYIKTPMYKMLFRNGTSIRGFVSGLGVKTDGSGGGTIRGASADVIYLDEMDMIPEEILDKVITPILLTKPDVILHATSTPIGKRGKFHQWCLDRSDFKEDYYPSTVLPHWEDIKLELESESTEEGFDAEYMACFVEGSYGVFRPSWVHAARANYGYHQTLDNEFLRTTLGIPDPSNMFTCIGIDWNKNAGTEFFVISYSTSTGTWYSMEAINIPASDYSAKRWMEEVIRLNHKWKPNWIYADEGYGHTIIEDLFLYAHRLKSKPNKNPMEQQSVQLTERLVGFNFSKNVELRDPIDGTIIKKAGKHFIVENASRIFQDGLIWYPEDDEKLTKQLLNYVVLRSSPTTGKPVYGPDNIGIGDHRVDALMLALAGLSLEVSVYSGNQLPISRPKFIDKGSGEEPYKSPRDETKGLFREAKERGLSGFPKVLQIIRGENLEVDKLIKQKYNAEETLTSRGHSRRSRGDIGRAREPDTYQSIFEGLASHSNHTRGHEMDLEGINEVKSISKPHRVKPRVRSRSRASIGKKKRR